MNLKNKIHGIFFTRAEKMKIDYIDYMIVIGLYQLLNIVITVEYKQVQS